MEQELKTHVERIRDAVQKWEDVREIAKDVIAYLRKDASRFHVDIDISVNTKIIRAYIGSMRRYAVYGDELNELTLRQIFEKFFSDQLAFVNIIRELAEAVVEVADREIEKLQN